MATLQKIRDRGPLIAIVIGFALLAFILGDLLSGGQSMFRSSETALGSVNGDPIGVQEFQRRFNNHKTFIQNANGLQNLNQEQERQLRDETWSLMVNEMLLVNDLEDMGLWVSDREVSELILGNNRRRDPIMQQIAIFTDQQTRQFSPQAVRQFFNNINSSDMAREFGLYLEDLIRVNKAQSKFQTLLTKGMHITKPEARQLYKERVHMVDFDFIFKSYQSIPDEEISVSDEELKSYYEAHKNEYEQNMSRDIAFVAFDILPTKEDREDTKETVMQLKKDMQDLDLSDTEAVTNFIGINSDERFINKYYAAGEFEVPEVDSMLFTAEKGDIIGPFEQNGYFKLAAVADRGMYPDTVQASHILIAPDGAQIGTMDEAKVLIDSLETVLKNGGDFAALADEYSLDTQSALKGGDLGKFTESEMVKPFSDACFSGNTGDLKKVETQFGWHLIKITYQSDKKEKIFPVILSKLITPGEKTLEDTYSKASVFATNVDSHESFEKEAQKLGLAPRIATDLTPNTRVIAGVENPDGIISWTFRDKTKKASVSEVFQSGEQFIVAIVTEVREEGIAPFEQVKDLIKPEVIKEKKAEILSKEIAEALKGNNDMQAVANTVNAQFSNQRNMAFSATLVSNIGAEPRVIGIVTSMPKDKVSEPIIGENGIFVVKVTSVTAKAEITDDDIKPDLINAERELVFSTSRRIFEALRERADLEDNRYKFF